MLEIKLTAMAHGGEALGRDAAGRVVFVPYALAGETARVEITSTRKEFARARVLEILTPSPARVTPRCPHFGPPSPSSPRPPSPSPQRTGEGEGGAKNKFVRGCGGCQWQHIAYDAQREFKTQIVREQFARIARMPDAPVAAMRGSVDPWNYRNHMRFTLNENDALCLQALESHDLIPIRECHIMDAPLVSMFGALELEGTGLDAVTLRAGENTGDRLIVLEAGSGGPPEIETDEAVSLHFQVEGRDITLIGREALEERVGVRTFRISPSSFFQVNTPMAEVLLALAAEFLAPRAGEVLLDAYGGVGLFGLSLAKQVARVIEIEEYPEALADAQYNARDLDNVAFHAGRVEEILPGLESAVHLAVLDPPRAGLDAAVVEALAAKAPRVIVYVSCDPATLARDARRLVERGYRLTHVQPVDLFPQTYHIECVARLERVPAGG